MSSIRQLAVFACVSIAFWGQATVAAEARVAPPAPAFHDSPMRRVELGDQIRVEVFDNEDLLTTTYVAEDGSIRMPLGGAVQVAGLSPDEAARKIEAALKAGQYLIDPHVTVTLAESYRPQVTVVGEVANQGRYEISPNQTVLDVIALAGGISDKGSDRIYIIRTDKSGKMLRLPVKLDLGNIIAAGESQPDIMQALQAGDSIVVPKATFTIVGEVSAPGEYRIETGMVLLQAIARAGGVTPLGSASRVEIQRRGADDKFFDMKGRKETVIEPGDVIRVKERIF